MTCQRSRLSGEWEASAFAQIPPQLLRIIRMHFIHYDVRLLSTVISLSCRQAHRRCPRKLISARAQAGCDQHREQQAELRPITTPGIERTSQLCSPEAFETLKLVLYLSTLHSKDLLVGKEARVKARQRHVRPEISGQAGP